MDQKIKVIFVLDGGPLMVSKNTPATCSLTHCFKPSVGTFIVLDDDNKELGSVQLCKEDGQKLATGGV